MNNIKPIRRLYHTPIVERFLHTLNWELQREVDGNSLQKLSSGWTVVTMPQMEYRCRRLAGLRWLRQEVSASAMGCDPTTLIRFRLRHFWFAVATMSQMILYYFPSLAIEFFFAKPLAVR